MSIAKNIPFNSYDQVPYLGISHALTHPDVMATIGTLLGLNPARLQKCRVLELGCANGSNLIPMASSFPGSEFIGLDFSGVQIAEGQKAVEMLNLNNIDLRQMDIMEVDARFGLFDYIIVHGIFSWVSEAVRDRILTICNRNLAPEGIAYISYNTFPGWHTKKIARDMMLYHTRNISEPVLKIRHARSFIDFLTNSAVSLGQRSKGMPGEIYINILKHENEWLKDNTDTYLFHEELEENNDPVYFFQFIEMAGRHGLQYLSEAKMNEVFMSDIPSEIRQSLMEKSGDLIELEQNRDFLMNRRFRSTLLVHQEQQISRLINPERISNLFIGSNCLPVSSNPDISSRAVEQFVCSPGIKMRTDHPVTKAAMLYLSQIWPDFIKMDELLERSYTYLRQSSPFRAHTIPENTEERKRDMQVLKTNLLKGFISSSSLVELHVHAPAFTTLLSERPVASPWARYQVLCQAETMKDNVSQKSGRYTVTNLRHESIELDGILPYILYHLDGTYKRNELISRLNRSLEDGTLSVLGLHENEKEVDETQNGLVSIEQAKKALGKNLDKDLHWLAKAALLVA